MTAQIPEELLLDGEELGMPFCPPLPWRHPRIVRANEAEPIIHSTACRRGYEGRWEIKNGLFYLVGLRGRFRLIEGDPVHATWFSGVLRVWKGDLLEYVHSGFDSVTEYELQIEVKRGVVVESCLIDNRRP